MTNDTKQILKAIAENTQVINEVIKTTTENSQMLAVGQVQFDEIKETLDDHTKKHEDTLTKLDNFTDQIQTLSQEQTLHGGAIKNLEEHAGIN